MAHSARDRPVSWPGAHRWDTGRIITVRRIELGLKGTQRIPQISTAKIGTPEVGADHVGTAKVCATQVSGHEQRPTQTRTAQVDTLKVRSHEIRPTMVNACTRRARSLPCACSQE